MAGLSRMIGRPPGYVSACLRGRPKVLPERERSLLARYFDRHEADMLPLTLRDARREQMFGNSTPAAALKNAARTAAEIVREEIATANRRAGQQRRRSREGGGA